MENNNDSAYNAPIMYGKCQIGVVTKYYDSQMFLDGLLFGIYLEPETDEYGNIARFKLIEGVVNSNNVSSL